MKAPLVSISLPVYNRAHIVGPSIRSVLDQTFQDFEFIIVDDGSSDAIEEVVKSFNDPRVRFVRHPHNRGLYATRNAGIHESRGVYLAFQDSDDLWHPRKLEEEIALLVGTPEHVGGVYSRWKKIFLDGTVKEIPPLDYPSKTSGRLLENFLRGDYFLTMQAVLAKKVAIEKSGYFDESFPVFGDAEFSIRFSKHFDLLYNPHVRVTIPLSDDSISRNKKKRLDARERIFQKELDTFKQYPDIFAENAYTLARSFRAAGERIKALQYARLALMTKVRPRYAAAYLRALIG